MDETGAKIIELPNGQVEVVDVPKSEPPTLAQEAAAAVVEGDWLLEKLSLGYVTIGAGDFEAEVIRALVSSVRGFAQIATGSLMEVRAYADQQLAQIG